MSAPSSGSGAPREPGGDDGTGVLHESADRRVAGFAVAHIDHQKKMSAPAPALRGGPENNHEEDQGQEGGLSALAPRS